MSDGKLQQMSQSAGKREREVAPAHVCNRIFYQLYRVLLGPSRCCRS